jgi:hypothetical protein
MRQRSRTYDLRRVKIEKNFSHYIHFQLQNNAPYAFKLHLK